MSDLKSDFKSRRQAVRFSQSELARRSGVPRARICLYELGDLELTDAEQTKIRAALQAEADRLRSLSTVIVPLSAMSDEEIQEKISAFRKMAAGCIEHALELERWMQEHFGL